MCKRHKHADLIIAWANGAKIQYRIPQAGRLVHPWHDIGQEPPQWYEEMEYRIKPEPQPDRVFYGQVVLDTPTKAVVWGLGEIKWDKANLKLIFDGETSSLKKIEVI